MSDVRDYYKSHPSAFDDLHKLLDRESTIQAQLPAIRQQMLSCCGAERCSSSGKVELVVTDTIRWDALSKEFAAITAKLDAIDSMVEKLDSILAEIKGEGLDASPTVRGIWSLESCHRTPGKLDEWGHRGPNQHDPHFLTWAERAEAALAEAQKIVG